MGTWIFWNRVWILALSLHQCLSQHWSFLSSLQRATLFVMASMITHKSSVDACAVHRGFRFLQAHLLRFPNSVGTNSCSECSLTIHRCVSLCPQDARAGVACDRRLCANPYSQDLSLQQHPGLGEDKPDEHTEVQEGFAVLRRLVSGYSLFCHVVLRCGLLWSKKTRGHLRYTSGTVQKNHLSPKTRREQRGPHTRLFSELDGEVVWPVYKDGIVNVWRAVTYEHVRMRMR